MAHRDGHRTRTIGAHALRLGPPGRSYAVGHSERFCLPNDGDVQVGDDVESDHREIRDTAVRDGWIHQLGRSQGIAHQGGGMEIVQGRFDVEFFLYHRQRTAAPGRVRRGGHGVGLVDADLYPDRARSIE